MGFLSIILAEAILPITYTLHLMADEGLMYLKSPTTKCYLFFNSSINYHVTLDYTHLHFSLVLPKSLCDEFQQSPDLLRTEQQTMPYLWVMSKSKVKPTQCFQAPAFRIIDSLKHVKIRFTIGIVTYL